MNASGKPAKQKEKTLICPVCGKKFKTKPGNQKYCSLECRKKNELLIRRRRYRANPEAIRERSREYYYEHHKGACKRQSSCKTQKKKDLEVRTCPICGKVFQPRRKDNIYCSKHCRERASYLRHHEERLEKQRKYKNENKEKYAESVRKSHLKRKEKIKAREKRIKIYGLDMDEFVETREDANCPYDFDCFHCPEPDCVVD